MEGVVTVFQGAFAVLGVELFGVPIIAWLVIVALFGLIGAFIKGKK